MWKTVATLINQLKYFFFKKEKQDPKFPRAIKIRIKCFANLGIYRAKL